MKELSKQFTGTGEVDGFIFNMTDEGPKAYVYSVTMPEVDSVHYEVFERVETKDVIANINGKQVMFEAKVKYPKSGDFGVWAFTFPTYESAMNKFNELSLKTKKNGVE